MRIDIKFRNDHVIFEYRNDYFGKLGILTANHCIVMNPDHDPKEVSVMIEGEEYKTTALHSGYIELSETKNDMAVLLLSDEDEKKLRAKGFTGIVITMREDFPARGTKIFGLGFPA